MPTRPNLLLIFTDQQRWDTMAAYGNRLIHTPNLDRMASEGAVFENCITPSPVCVSARAATMSGYAPSKTGCLDNTGKLADDRDTLAAHLSAAGYHTQAIGKMHFLPMGQSYGFDGQILSEEMRFARWAKSLDAVAFDDYDRFLIERNLWGWEKPPEIGYNEIKPLVNPLPKECHVTQWCGDRTVQWLAQDRPRDKPFFLWTSFVKPHVPYDCPQHLFDLYDQMDVPRPWVSDDPSRHRNPYYREKRRLSELDLYSDEATRRARAYYYANITFIDEQVGRILQTLKDQGLDRNTFVLFTADHGDLLGDHGQWYKEVGYEGSLHIPMLAWWPGKIAPGSRVGDIVSLLDVFPTFMQQAGLTDYADRPGRNLLDFLAPRPGISRASREINFSEINRPPQYRLHIRHRDWKYMHYQNGGFEELYDLKNDPYELHNLADDPGYRHRMEDLKSAAIDWLRTYGNPALALDPSGRLRALPYRPGPSPLVQATRLAPFSRMPWESRIPPACLPEDKRPYLWRATGGDWSQLFEFARRRAQDTKPETK